jgi:transcriptional regulator with XRE-family HTH domain
MARFIRTDEPERWVYQPRVCGILGGVTTNETLGIDAAVSAVLRAEAAARKLTWPALAERSGVSKSTMSNYLNDVSAPKLGVLQDIAEALGLDLFDVLRLARERQQQANPVTIQQVTALVPETPQTAGTPRNIPAPRGSSQP